MLALLRQILLPAKKLIEKNRTSDYFHGNDKILSKNSDNLQSLTVFLYLEGSLALNNRFSITELTHTR